MKLNVIDLFSGCGGLTDGFLQTGRYKTLAAVDWELPPVKTLQKRMQGKWGYDLSRRNVFHFDIQRTDELLYGFNDTVFGRGQGLVKIIGSKKVDVIIGGPPCQAYSIAGRVRDEFGMQNDYRNYLFESYVKIVSHFNPKAFVFENVEGILSAKPGGVPILERIRESFSDIGYEIVTDLRQSALFDTSNFGIPQKRKRVIIFGVQKSDKGASILSKFYMLMNKQKQQEIVDASSAFQGLPKIFPIEATGKTKPSHSAKINGEKLPLNHEPRFHSARDIDIFRTLTKDIQLGENKYDSVKALIQLYKERTGKESKFHKYHVIREDRPSNTIPAHLYKDGLRHIHPDPEQARTITAREAARLQTFDDEFEFLGSQGDQYKMIGNAVPPRFAKLIAASIWHTFKHQERE